jgi:hypothetical protein
MKISDLITAICELWYEWNKQYLLTKDMDFRIRHKACLRCEEINEEVAKNVGCIDRAFIDAVCRLKS